MPKKIRIGTRGSDLALWQAHHVQDLLKHLGSETEITVIKTQGDKIDNVPLSELEGKGFFTKELEDAQLDGRVDMAVHSLKDLSTEMPEGLTLAAMIGREDPRELLLIRKDGVDPQRMTDREILPLRDKAVIGTSAARRQAQLRILRPDLQIKDLRGNVPTRVNRLREGQYDAILIARAGVRRLELELDDLVSCPLDVEAFIPAPGQGMLGIQCRDEEPLSDLLGHLNCEEAARAVRAERQLLKALEAGCQLPFGVNVRREGDHYRMVVFWQDPKSPENRLRFQIDGPDPMALASEAEKIITERT
ncbi:MAG: hydroxymethylbilane synthase [Candidatus Eisenbacteria bacterium]|nr:hydroxymethylbilane synthase [Candidatus Eisenbacteria bacterium]MBU1950284.1 hydroxymethylbilane synthase [Candidatus Eisenbacteria bacterium]